MICQKCKSSNFDENEQSEIFCLDCGVVIDTNCDDNDEHFEFTDDGRVVYVGQDVDTIRKTKNFEMRKKSIFDLCGKLALDDSVANTALEYYRGLALHGHTKRESEQVAVGVCVYLAARAKRRSVLLLHVSARVGASVYRLGHFFKKWSKLVSVAVPPGDRLTFLRGFAAQLELGEKQESVEKSAARLMLVMEKDEFGSRLNTSDLSKVALLVACRMHGFDRDYKDVARVASIRETYLKKLVKQWTESSSANMTNEKLQEISAQLESANKESVNSEDRAANRDVVDDVVSSDGESLEIGDSDDDEEISSYLFNEEEQKIMGEIYDRQNRL